MRALQLVAVVALHQRWRADRQVSPTLALAGFGYFSLGNAHALLLGTRRMQTERDAAV